MADDDDEVDEGKPSDPTYATAGPRRSTFTPPPAAVQGDGAVDDDALADAIAAEYTLLGSGTILLPKIGPDGNPIPGTTPPPPSTEPAPPTAQAAPAQPEQFPPAPAPPSVAPPSEGPAPWELAPAPNPTHAVPLDHQFDPPARRSLPDEELQRLVDSAETQPGGTLDVIERLQEQLQLREEEAREYRAWEERMRSLDAEAPQPGTDAPPEDWTPPPADPPAPEAAPATLPAWEVPPPSPGWTPLPDYEPEAETGAPPTWDLDAFVDETDVVVEATIDAPHEDAELPEEDFGPPPLVEPPPFRSPEASGFGAPSDDSDAHSFDLSLDAAALEQPAPTGPPVQVQPPSGVPTPATPSAAFSFDDLITGTPDPALSDLIAPVTAGEPLLTTTGSIFIPPEGLDRDVEDDVDETDRILGALVSPLLPEPVAPPSGPIATVRIPQDEQVLIDNEPQRQLAFSIELAGEEPTPAEHRAGRAARLFWLWFAANASILSLGLGAAVFAVGMSLRQSIVAILAGIALSFIPLGLTTLAGKRSGQPTMVVSRATFGLLGNIVPAVVAVITRVFWGAVMLWLLGSSIAIVLVGAGLAGGMGERMLLLISLAVGFILAVLVAFAGYPMMARIQLALTIVSGVLIVGLIAATAQYINLEQALSAQDGPWLLTVTGAVLVFSFVGLVWANSGADLARYQRVDSSGASSMLWATFGATLPAFVLIGYGALLAASNPALATGLLQSPLDALPLMLPLWYPVPVMAAAILSLLSGITITLYSGGFALQSVGMRAPRQVWVLVVAVLLGLLALLFTFGVAGGILELFRDAATTLAVPTAAWAGIFAAETMIRNRRFASESLIRRGGVYEDVRWGNLIAFAVISLIGFAFTTATISWLSWQGYGFALLGVPLDGDFAGTDLGVLMALALGLLWPIVFGIGGIRRQEEAKADRLG